MSKPTSRKKNEECAKLEASAQAIMKKTDELQKLIENARSIINEAKMDSVYSEAPREDEEDIDDLSSEEQEWGEGGRDKDEGEQDTTPDLYEVLQQNGDLVAEDEEEGGVEIEGELIPFVTIMPEDTSEENKHIQLYEDALNIMKADLDQLRQEFWHKVSQLTNEHPDSKLLKDLTAEKIQSLGPVKAKLLSKKG